MYKILVLLRVGMLTAASYRITMVMSLGGLLASVVPIYFVANALQPVMADAIHSEGGQYFGFVLIGMITFSFLTECVRAMPGVISGGIATGTLEALVSTRTRLPTVLAGLMSYNFLWLAVRAILLLVAGTLLGAQFLWDRMLLGGGILLLILLAYLPFGILGAALILAFRTTARVSGTVLTLSLLLGGVYYPTHVIPAWIEKISWAIPLTYGLRALRRVVLEGFPLGGIVADLAVLAGFVVVLTGGSVVAFMLAFRYARRSGTLAHY